MPNAFAHLVFYSWPIVVVILFRKLPLTVALVWSMVLGYILVPWNIGIDFPAMPTIGKYEITTISAAIMCVFVVREQRKRAMWDRSLGAASAAPTRKSRGRWIVRILFGLLLIAPILTVMHNGDPIFAGPRVVPGLRLYDALSVIGTTLFTLLPFFLALRFLTTTESHKVMLRALCLTMIVYSLPALYEIRMSPQLNRMIYGFVSSSFLQHMRAGGFRPLVFFDHGLSLGIFMAMSILATVALWRGQTRAPGKSTFMIIVVVWLLMTLVLAKNVGALAITIVLLPFALWMRVGGQLVLAASLSAVVLLYPMLRGAGYVPADEIHSFALSYSEDRAQSLKFRLDHEDALLEKANQRPILGWGIWGRNRIFDEETGRDLSVTDGVWVIVIGTAGWLGYVANFGLLTFPSILLALKRRRLNISITTSGLGIVLAANLVDLLPNAALTPITWLLAGALMGRYIAASEESRMPPTSQSDETTQPVDKLSRPHKTVVRKPRTARLPVQDQPQKDDVSQEQTQNNRKRRKHMRTLILDDEPKAEAKPQPNNDDRKRQRRVHSRVLPRD